MSISKIYIVTKFYACSHKSKIENILNRIFILLLGSCPWGGTWGAGGGGGVKNFSVGICDGAPPTADSSCNLELAVPYMHIIYVYDEELKRGNTGLFTLFTR